MTRRLRVALVTVVAIVTALLAGLLTGAFDDVVRRIATLYGSGQTAGSTDVASISRQDPLPAVDANADPSAAQRVIPIFDLVRVEPSGDAVIAGQGLPDAEVEILSGMGIIASGKANAAGEWAVVLSEPLRSGAHDLTVRTRSPAGDVLTSEQSVAVSVPEGGKGEVLVVLNQPGVASTVLQVPGEEEAREAIADAGANAPVLPQDLEAPAAVAEGPAASADSPTADTPVAEAPAAEPTAESDAAASVEVADVPAETVQPVDPSSADPATAQSGVNATELAPGAEVEVAVAADEPAPPADAGSPATVVEATTSPTVEGGASVVIAPEPSAPAGSADATAPSLSTPAAGGEPPTGGDTAAATAPGSDAVPTEAAPEQSEIVVASNETASDAGTATGNAAGAESSEAAAAAGGTAPEADPSGKSDRAGATAPETDVAALAPAEVDAVATAPAVPVTIEAVELENGARFFAAGAAAAGAQLRVYVDGSPVKDVTSMNTGRWLLDTPLSLTPGNHTVRVDQVAGDGQVVSRAEVPFEIQDDIATAPTAVSGSGAGGPVAGPAGEARVGQSETLIIRRGDNLWQIARRLYGRGVRYSTIYEANTDQIRNPDLIYPGQVFVIPQGDTDWPAETAVE